MARPCAWPMWRGWRSARSEEHTSELQSQSNLVCRLLLEKKKIRSEEHTSELQSQSISYAVFCLKKTNPRAGSDREYVLTRRLCRRSWDPTRPPLGVCGF